MSSVDRPASPALMLTALGIVYGDLGTSPLYAMQAVVGTIGDTGGQALGGQTPLGILSLIAWALVLTISVKYCALVMRADNGGEGGILALMSLTTSGQRRWVLIGMGLFGAALIYGDGAITPAISVLSALEGVTVVTDAFKPYVLPAALVILAALFAAQAWGTAQIGRVFGPVMLLWFVTIAAIGLVQVIAHPRVLAAVNPLFGLHLLAAHPAGALAVLGGVFLVVTGGEALYADMGHVGRRPIRVAWVAVVLPALLLSYAGQTGLLLDGKGGANPFWAAVPHWAVIPMVALATAATVIASQAIITGTFSLTRQAMQLGWLPGVVIRQTSDREYGQIYVPVVNWAMMAVTLALTLAFRSSDSLAGAYGTAVSTTMLLTTGLLFFTMTEVWHWRVTVALPIAILLLAVDIAFFAANLLKIAEGGWIPLTLGTALFSLMLVWSSGVAALRRRMGTLSEPAEPFLRRLASGAIPRVEGTAVFLTRAETPVPSIMVRHAADMGALHRRLATLAVVFEQTPRIAEADRLHVEQVAEGFWHLTAHYGFVEIPDLPTVLEDARAHGCELGLDEAIYFGARDTVVRSDDKPQLSPWVRAPFAMMYRNALRTVDRFRLPADRFVEVGRQIGL